MESSSAAALAQVFGRAAQYLSAAARRPPSRRRRRPVADGGVRFRPWRTRGGRQPHRAAASGGAVLARVPAERTGSPGPRLPRRRGGPGHGRVGPRPGGACRRGRHGPVDARGLRSRASARASSFSLNSRPVTRRSSPAAPGRCRRPRRERGARFLESLLSGTEEDARFDCLAATGLTSDRTCWCRPRSACGGCRHARA